MMNQMFRRIIKAEKMIPSTAKLKADMSTRSWPIRSHLPLLPSGTSTMVDNQIHQHRRQDIRGPAPRGYISRFTQHLGHQSSEGQHYVGSILIQPLPLYPRGRKDSRAISLAEKKEKKKMTRNITSSQGELCVSTMAMLRFVRAAARKSVV